ncbi:unnamed protein product (macronuclear) [Paramecium tetraurelia]|uniref:Uncharacterized protein n=1 Tax=Paramecium tetraurelia TaxID=5888 RepID=A0C5G1_PARTE|nr:uncharacterized protein GSPATT00006527001 [Paramecium tetraurelia]CAK66028.1 unnamed protein product [Paramecium tetraurelia]|eukprot:XP_001433425.1 hypothetical protein (macronuclear) [Paramecium tetraurelia strain d4-2]
MINQKSLGSLQLIPENFQRSSKSLTTIIRKHIKEEEKRVRPIKFLFVNQEKKNKLNLGEVEKYKSLLRTGASSFIFYIYKNKECQDNFFDPLLRTEIKVPLIDTTLSIGIHVWDHIHYIDHKSINVYQFQCILGRQEDENNALLFVVSQLASKIVVIIENWNQEEVEIIKQLKNHGFGDSIDVFNLLFTITSPIYFDFEEVRYVNLYENYLQEKVYSNERSSKDTIRLWQEETLMSLNKKTYRDIEVDILTVLSVVNYLKQSNFQEENYDLIFMNAFKKQIEYSKKDIQEQYILEIQKLCSSSNHFQQNSLLSTLNQIRNNAQSQFYQQLSQFYNLEEYKRQQIELFQLINNIEEDCLNLFYDVAHYNLLQRMKHNIKSSQNNNDTFLNHYQHFLSILSSFDDVMGVKYKYLKKHFKKQYNKLIQFYTLSTYEREQREYIQQVELDLSLLQSSVDQIQNELEDFEDKIKISQSKHHTRQSSLQTTALCQSQHYESLIKLNQKVETLQSQPHVRVKQ